MKKSLKNTIIKSIALVAFSFLLFSCGSTPKAEATPIEPAETAAPVEEESAEEPAPAEEQKEEETQPAEEIPDEPQVEEPKEEPAYEPIQELIEDIPGYYESDPEPVYLQPSEKTSKEEEKAVEEIPEEKPAVEEEKESVKEEPKEALKEEETTEPVAPVEKEPEKVVVQPAPEPVKVTVIPAPVKPEPAVVESVEVAGITAAEEVESSELLSESNESEEADENAGAEKSENKIVVVPSRAVEMKNSQYLDIIYPGSGWIYLGEVDNKTNMRYFGRKIGERNTVFSLRSREEGNTILHFYKNDQLTGKFIDDYLQVEISGTNNSPEHAVAPSYAEAVPPKPEKKVLTQPKPVETHEKEILSQPEASNAKPVRPASTSRVSTSKPAPVKTEQKKIPVPAPVPAVSAIDDSSDSGTKTVIQKKTSEGEHKAVPKSENSVATETEAAAKTAPAVSKSSIQNTENMAADDILEKARESFKNKKYEETLAYLDDFFAKATTKIDEGLMLQGQTFESNSSVRNIKSALDTYETIVRRYPQSIHWPKANERITYLKKFYFNIR